MKNGGFSARVASEVFMIVIILLVIFLFDIWTWLVIGRSIKWAHELAQLARFSLPVEWIKKPLEENVILLKSDVTIISNK